MDFKNGQAGESRGRFFLLYGMILLGIVVFTLLPIISVLVSSAIANAAGCVLNEAQAHPCIIAGIDTGGLLYTMAVLGWLMLMTIPTGVMLLICWVLALIVHIGLRVIRR